MRIVACSAMLASASIFTTAAIAQPRPSDGTVNPGEKVIFDNAHCKSGKGYIIGGSRKQGIKRKEGCVPGHKK